MPRRAPRAVPKIEGWLRELHGGDRLEIFLRVDRTTPPAQPRKIRASGPKQDMLELVEWFEEKTGLRVTHPVLGPRPQTPIPGQVELPLGGPPNDNEPSAELSSGATVET